MPELSRAEARSVPESSIIPYASGHAPRLDMVGLNPNQATFTSEWQTFDGVPPVAKAPVQRWKDQRGIEHFVDVLPTAKNSAEVGATPSKHHPKTP